VTCLGGDHGRALCPLGAVWGACGAAIHPPGSAARGLPPGRLAAADGDDVVRLQRVRSWVGLRGREPVSGGWHDGPR